VLRHRKWLNLLKNRSDRRRWAGHKSSKRVHDGEPILSFVDNTGLSRSQVVKYFVFRFESFLGLRCGQAHLRETSTNERIDDVHAGVHEISTVSRGDRQTVDDRSRRDEAILNRHSFPGCPKTRQQFRPFQSRVRIPGKTVETPDPRVEPAFQGGPPP
jgi:hypothetical protein